MNGIDPTLRAASRAAGAEVLSIADERYPPLLRTIADPPELLYARGNLELLQQPQLAVVGARKASAAGLSCAYDLAADVASTGLHICSGLALGVDGAAHRGALSAGGKTIAVMATGINQIYPYRHGGLGEEIARGGCLVTEFPPGTPPRRGHFPRRNRIISGLSLGVLVVEAALPSGSLITAGTALEQGREVFTLPWSISHRGGAGCLKLLRDGAKMVQQVDDILEELGPLFSLQRDMLVPDHHLPKEAVANESAVLKLVGYEATSVNSLVSCSGLSVAQVMGELSELEIDGSVMRCAGGYIRT